MIVSGKRLPFSVPQPAVAADAVGRLSAEFSSWWREVLRAEALESSEGADAKSTAEVQNLQTIAEPVKTESAKRYIR